MNGKIKVKKAPKKKKDEDEQKDVVNDLPVTKASEQSTEMNQADRDELDRELMLKIVELQVSFTVDKCAEKLLKHQASD